MKRLLVAVITIIQFLFISFFATGQTIPKRQPGYLFLKGRFYQKDDVRGVANISIGALKNKEFGIGFGIGYIGLERPYLPITFDLTYFGKSGKVTPIIQAQAGYGIYDYENAYAQISGGFTGAINAGISLPAKKSKFILLIGAQNLHFPSSASISFKGLMMAAPSFLRPGNYALVRPLINNLNECPLPIKEWCKVMEVIWVNVIN